MAAEERFRRARILFEDEDYAAAISEFTVITLQHQGSAFADSAQFFIAESQFQRHQYIVAATEYGYLRQSYPASPLVADAQYKRALCFYHLSPESKLDQQYTKKAIDEFQAFVEYYPRHPEAADAAAKIAELNVRLAQKSFETARLYEIMESYRASGFYYDDVIENYHDTPYAPLAYLGKVEVLIARKKYEEAQLELRKFTERFPGSVLQARADKLRTTIERELERKGGGARGKPQGHATDIHQRIPGG